MSDWTGTRCALWNDYPKDEYIVVGCKYWEQPQPWKRPCKWGDA